MCINDNDLYQEYADQIAEENGDLYGTNKFQTILANSSTFQIVDRLAEYEEKLLNRALKELKNKQEWQDLEADDIRAKTTGFMIQMNASELLEHYKGKIQHMYKVEAWFKAKIDECDRVIAETNTWRTQSKRKTNKLKHWRSERARFCCKYKEYIKRSNRYERLIYKWASVCEQIRQADIAKEIEAEKHGIGNKYGFNPFIRSRETVSGIFLDEE